jgi:hypothetical protein
MEGASLPPTRGMRGDPYVATIQARLLTSAIKLVENFCPVHVRTGGWLMLASAYGRVAQVTEGGAHVHD